MIKRFLIRTEIEDEVNRLALEDHACDLAGYLLVLFPADELVKIVTQELLLFLLIGQSCIVLRRNDNKWLYF